VLGSLAAFGAFLIVRSAWRAAQIVRTDLRLAMLTRQAATPLAASSEADAFEVGGLQGVSLAGILRPRILVGSAAAAALTPAELDAAISHEVAHQRSRDNLKRFLIYCAPDVLGWSGAARRLEEAWQAESECQADARAVRGDERRALVLASALVKVARLMRRPGLIVPSPGWSAFHVPSLLETRVARLVSGRATLPGDVGRMRFAPVVCAFGIPAAVWILNLSYSLHLVTEVMVTRLP
jgi:beta-lactamase regulating signal transducer with metallopeptidase domain